MFSYQIDFLCLLELIIHCLDLSHFSDDINLGIFRKTIDCLSVVDQGHIDCRLSFFKIISKAVSSGAALQRFIRGYIGIKSVSEVFFLAAIFIPAAIIL